MRQAGHQQVWPRSFETNLRVHCKSLKKTKKPPLPQRPPSPVAMGRVPSPPSESRGGGAGVFLLCEPQWLWGSGTQEVPGEESSPEVPLVTAGGQTHEKSLVCSPRKRWSVQVQADIRAAEGPTCTSGSRPCPSHPWEGALNLNWGAMVVPAC